MKAIRVLAAVVIAVSAVPVLAFGASYGTWEDVLSSREPVKIYIEEVVNNSDDVNIDPSRSTEVVKKVFKSRRQPRFDIVGSKEKADIIFEGKISDYVWMEEAPVTNVWSAGALVMDLATRRSKNYARKLISYKIYSADGTTLFEKVTQATLKQSGMPEEKSYDMMAARAQRMLGMDLFGRFRRDTRRSGPVRR